MKRLLLTFVASAFFVVFISGCSAVKENTNEVISFVENEEYVQAKEKLDEVAQSTELSEEDKDKINRNIEQELIKEVGALKESFQNEEVDVETLHNQLSGYKVLGLNKLIEKINQTDIELESLINSRVAFTNGERHIENKDYDLAIDEFSMVIEEDAKFAQAQTYIDESYESLLTQVKNEAVSLEEKEEYSNAYTYVKGFTAYFTDDDSYIELLNQYEELYFEQSLAEVEKLKANNELDKAVYQLEQMESELGKKEEIVTLLHETKAQQEEQVKQKREALLSNMNQQYDSMDDITRISPKGIDPFTLNIPQGSFVFFPMIQIAGQDLDSGIAAISVVTGFSQDDWVFMEKISFNVDGDRFSWELDYGERGSEVGWGSIYEWVIKNSLVDGNIKGDLEKIANAESVEIRYDGDSSSRDETLSQTQIQQIKDTLELYEMINKYGL
ncbi:tetratricopeptide (TPR) repeat protein [Salirhabdus euzebyi]|uniref:Tetratricopeptide (TPR) repeat protein n=1 Tax=Salirhabdus euzebyi TaxID=394506 RepID=A0A841Q5Q7_9BACI|nr:hypothetical protein [Salirhabdus euzebyi]MBB6453693.1 tetratricopeptide (TPR) repeat protein [Salirhabdus euzebyi]